MMHTIADTIATEGRANNNEAHAKNPNTVVIMDSPFGRQILIFSAIPGGDVARRPMEKILI